MATSRRSRRRGSLTPSRYGPAWSWSTGGGLGYRRSMGLLFWVLGLLNVANGLWMLATPARWYHDLPAGVPDTGPLNLHFVRDIGSAFTTIGVAFCVAAVRPQARRGV